MTTVAIHQPGYFPWLGLIDKIARADLFIVLDTVQFNRAAYQHRTLYSTAAGAKLLTLPVRHAGFLQSGLPIREVELANLRMPAKHFETLRGRYRKAPGWGALEEGLRELLLVPAERLMELSLASMRMTLQALGVERPMVLASELGCDGTKTDLVIELVKAVGADTYLSGTGARAYQINEEFEKAGIRLLYQNFSHPEWQQSQPGAFLPGCFALEWALETGEGAAAAFRQYLDRTATSGVTAC